MNITQKGTFMNIKSTDTISSRRRVALCIVGLVSIALMYAVHARRQKEVDRVQRSSTGMFDQIDIVDAGSAAPKQSVASVQECDGLSQQDSTMQDACCTQQDIDLLKEQDVGEVIVDECTDRQIGSDSSPSMASSAELQPVWLTVFVHGIMSVKPHLTINNFVRFLKDDVKDTYYEKSIAFMRENNFFYKNQAMGPLGLHYIDQRAGAQENMSSLAMAYLFDQTNELAHTHQYNNRYYTFGWSGLMSPRARYEDSKKLFEALDKEVCALRKKGFDPKVRVIGYSHGGNVSLNLGAAHQKDFPDSSLVIDELVLLGTPIQHDTDYLINDPVFKRIYNIYSLSDRVQRLDFFSLNRLFSGRVFSGRKDFKLPEKLVQIQVKVVSLRNGKGSVEERVEKTNNLRTRGVITGKASLLKNMSPGHAELWAFGWTPQHYRSTYPLHPLPIVFMLPYITYNLQDYHDTTRHRHHLIVDVRPEHEYILLRKPNKKRVEQVIPFISRQKLASLKEEIGALTPENYTREEYEQQTCNAIREAHEVYKQLYAPKGKKRFAKRCRLK